MKTSSVSLSLHHEVQLPERRLLDAGKFRNTTKITLLPEVVREGTRLGQRMLSLWLRLCWVILLCWELLVGCSSTVFTGTTWPVQALLPQEQKMRPLRFRGHSKPRLVQMTGSLQKHLQGPVHFLISGVNFIIWWWARQQLARLIMPPMSSPRPFL